jgi:hypothetical protein
MIFADRHIEDKSIIVKAAQLIDTVIFGILYAVMTVVVYSTVFISIVCMRIVCLFGLRCSPSPETKKRKSE